ncbi:MAG: dUTP diphosphatase [Bdellovibrionales bacterium CG12_big_fil_rev_8_21_14_0_65_38_15]|nr:MAG: dUTP diphosphatase [Bdellovibrionales bacterium CG22_combo_CG10-13_8_21_14_all_38_13]PIQ55273.1 MAG: dUTP diphosphatase [Bdellovibrionales bacterium CG12_big_fil_rev_8_21_14_0_65_38_15]PIR30777.1 MAG: dUTP diphosphatase [Bdellovibrionales bacterium CG11_big_fil_rev_8_21_14_0_20_38_13]
MANVKLLKLSHFDNDLALPSYETKLAAGADIRACLGKGESMTIRPGERVLVPTGLAMEIPPGFEIQVRPRSGLSFKTGLMVVNSPGTVDADYRGEVKVILGNLGTKDEVIAHGDRVAQFVLSPVIQANFEVASEINSTERGAGGFGSTGKN